MPETLQEYQARYGLSADVAPVAPVATAREQDAPRKETPPDEDAGLKAYRERYGLSYQEPRQAAAPEEVRDYDTGIGYAFMRGFERLRALPDVAQGDYKELAEHYGNMDRWKLSQGDQERMEELKNTEGFWGAVGYYLKNPTLVGHVVAESLPMMIAPIVGAVGGGMAGTAVGGPVGTVAGAMLGGGAGSYVTEYYNSIGEYFSEHGVSMDDAAGLKRAFNSQEMMQGARDHGVKRGIPIAIFDALSMGLAGRIAKPIAGAVRGAAGRSFGAGAISEMGMQAGFGMAGEAGAQLNVSGEITDMPGVVAEGFGEIVPGMFEAGVTSFLDKRSGAKPSTADELPDDESPLGALAQVEDVEARDIDPVTGAPVPRPTEALGYEEGFEDAPETRDELDVQLEDALADLQMEAERDAMVGDVARAALDTVERKAQSPRAEADRAQEERADELSDPISPEAQKRIAIIDRQMSDIRREITELENKKAAGGRFVSLEEDAETASGIPKLQEDEPSKKQEWRAYTPAEISAIDQRIATKTRSLFAAGETRRHEADQTPRKEKETERGFQQLGVERAERETTQTGSMHSQVTPRRTLDETPLDIQGGQPAAGQVIEEGEIVNPEGGFPGTSLRGAFEEAGVKRAEQTKPKPDAGPSDDGTPAPKVTPEQKRQRRVNEVAMETGPPAPTTETEPDRYADGVPESAPEPAVEYHDNRLRRMDHRGALSGLKNDLQVGGGVTLIPSEELGVSFKGRTPSTNPTWFQALASDEGISVKYVGNVIDKMLDGKRLTDKQKRVGSRLLDVVTGQREEAARELRAEAPERRERAEAEREDKEERAALQDEEEFVDDYDDDLPGFDDKPSESKLSPALQKDVDSMEAAIAERNELVANIEKKLRSHDSGFRDSMFFDEEDQNIAMADIEEALDEAGWESDPLGSELGFVYEKDGMSIAVQEHDVEGQYTIHQYSGPVDENAAPPKEVSADTGERGDIFTTQVDLEDLTGTPELDTLADEAEARLAKMPDGIPQTSTEFNMVVGDLRRLKMNKHPRADELAQKMEDKFGAPADRKLESQIEELRLMIKAATPDTPADVRNGMNDLRVKISRQDYTSGQTLINEMLAAFELDSHIADEREIVNIASSNKKRPDADLSVRIAQVGTNAWVATNLMSYNIGNMSGTSSAPSAMYDTVFPTRDEAFRSALERAADWFGSPMGDISKAQAKAQQQMQANIAGEINLLGPKSEEYWAERRAEMRVEHEANTMQVIEGETTSMPELAARDLEENYATKKLTPIQRASLRHATKLALNTQAKDSSFSGGSFINLPVRTPTARTSESGQDTKDGHISVNTVNQLIDKGVLVSALTYPVGTASMEARFRVPNIPEVAPASEVPTSNELAEAAAEADTNPTDAQKKAGNYKKGHIKLVPGVGFTIENAVGSKRNGRTMKDIYGDFDGTLGRDKDKIDGFVNPKIGEDFNGKVWIIDQIIDGEFDEHKVMFGYKSKLDAIRAYKRNYQKGWKVGPISEMPVTDFKLWLTEKGAGQRPAQQSRVFTKNRKAEAKDRNNQRFALGKDLYNAPDRAWLDTVLGSERTQGDVIDTGPVNEIVTQILEIEEREKAATAAAEVKVTTDKTKIKTGIETEVESMNAKFPEAKIVLADFKDLPKSVTSGLEATRLQRLTRSSTPAIFDFGTDTIYLFKDRIKNAADARKLALHEMFHKGISRSLGGRMNSVLDDFYNNMNLEQKAAFKEITSRYSLDEKNISERREAVEEIIAEIAETESNPGALKKIIAAVRKFLTEMGLIDATNAWTDAEIRQLIAESHQSLARKRDSIAGINIEEEVVLDQDGEVFVIEQDAQEALLQIDKRKKACATLRNCL